MAVRAQFQIMVVSVRFVAAVAVSARYEAVPYMLRTMAVSLAVPTTPPDFLETSLTPVA